MIKFADLSISRKLLTSSLLTTGAALLAAAIAAFLYQINVTRATAIRDLTAVAQIVAANSAGALAFRDAESAHNILEALKARPEIQDARIVDATGQPLATFGASRVRASFQDLDGKTLVVRRTRILIAEPVVFGSDTLGRLQISADLGQRLQAIAATGAVVMVLIVSVAMVVAYAITRRIQKAVTAPLFALANTAHQVAAKNDYSIRAAKVGEDEIGHLTDAFNHMLREIHARDLALQSAQRELSEKVSSLQQEMKERQRAEAELARTHQDLLEASRRAGQAEVATNVLHNVGNVLNSVIVSSNLIVERLRASKAANVTLAANLLVDHREKLGPFFSDDAKGKLLLTYLPQLGQDLETERAILLTETQALTRNVEHIKEIVSTQQAYSRPSAVDESANVSEVADHALALAAEALRHTEIEVIRHYDRVPLISVDKHRVLQILVNLIRNAAQAITAAVPEKPTLRIETDADDKFVRVRVIDNGIGIAPENVTKIFQHGFTTRRDGHGFGLHSGALAARQMRGQLKVYSDGPGRGATFTLELPLVSSLQ